MKKPLLQTQTRVRRTYRGGKMLDRFLGKENGLDGFYPEDWISSFTEAQNKDPVPMEGISHVLVGGKPVPITELVSPEDFGPGRSESGVLVKLLDAGERLGIQVHPTPAFSLAHFGSPHGKTECWHILHAEKDAAVFVGFREGTTREEWKRLFETQNVAGMLERLHRFPVATGDTILVRAGTPHAIGKGCFLLEIQEPTDYTMRAEKITVAGETLTPQQIHYGAGEEALLDCFLYEGLPEREAKARYFLSSQKGDAGFAPQMMVTYEDTPCFALGTLLPGDSLCTQSFVTLVFTQGGQVRIGETPLEVVRGDRIFVPYGSGKICTLNAEAIVCFPPKKGKEPSQC